MSTRPLEAEISDVLAVCLAVLGLLITSCIFISISTCKVQKDVRSRLNSTISVASSQTIDSENEEGWTRPLSSNV